MNLNNYYNDLWKRGGYPSDTADIWSFKTERMSRIHGKKVLDIGCGNGRLGSLLVTDNDVEGIDFSEKAVEEARKKGVKARVGDVAAGLPFSDKIFDMVLIADVLEHVFDPLGLLTEAKRVLKPGGSILFFIPNGANLLNRLLFFFTGDLIDHSGRVNILHPAFSFTGHIRIISPSLMKKMLKSLNLRVTWEDTWFPWVFETSPFNKINWLARCVHLLKLHKLFPGLIATLFFCECQK
jgi:ubiquinone/menaquinone biosynthesis C-methylase UbiE